MFIYRNTVIASLFALLTALLTLNPVVLLYCHGLLLILCLIDVFAAPAPKYITFERIGEEHLNLGESLTHQLKVKNMSKRKIRGWIRDCWPPSGGLAQDTFPFQLHAAEKCFLNEVFLPRRRGTRFSEFIAVRTLGPLRLAGRQRSFPSNWQIQVFPAFSARKHLPSRLVRLREMEGRSLLLVRGQGTEFDSLREYVAGDDVRAIDWRSSARLGQTLVRTWRPERDRKIVIVLDSGRAGAIRAGRFPAFDDYIETALLLALIAQRAGDSADIFTLDSTVRARVRVSANPNAIHKLASALADISPVLTHTDWQLANAEINRIAKQAVLVVLLTDTGITGISDGLPEAITRLAQNHKVLIGTVQNLQTGNDTDTREKTAKSDGFIADSVSPEKKILLHDSVTAEKGTEIFSELAGFRSELERMEINKRLTLFGANVITASSEDLPARIADAYIDLKTRGKL